VTPRESESAAIFAQAAGDLNRDWNLAAGGLALESAALLRRAYQKISFNPKVNCRCPCPFSAVIVPKPLLTGSVFGAPN